MRKIIVFILTLALIVSMAVSAYAVTPKWEYKPVKLPEIKVQPNFVENIVSNWFKHNPIDLPAINISYTRPVLG